MGRKAGGGDVIYDSCTSDSDNGLKLGCKQAGSKIELGAAIEAGEGGWWLQTYLAKQSA